MLISKTPQRRYGGRWTTLTRGNIAALLGLGATEHVTERIPEGAIKGVIAERFIKNMVGNTFGDDPVVLHENDPCSIVGLQLRDPHEMAQYTSDDQQKVMETGPAAPSKQLPP